MLDRVLLRSTMILWIEFMPEMDCTSGVCEKTAVLRSKTT